MKSLILTLTILLFSGNLYSGDRDIVRLANADLKQAEERLKMLSEKVRQFQGKYKGEMVVIATAYCNSPICINVSKWNDGITATGTVAGMQTIAVDPKTIPLGSIVYIEGMGWYKAEDKGGAIKGNRIDIFMGDYKKAREFGRKKVRVKIYQN